MNKLVLALVLMVSFAFSGSFANNNNNGNVSVSEPSQFIVDVGSGASTMHTVAKKSVLIKSTALNTHAKSKVSIGVKFAEGTGGYVANMSGLKHLSG